MLQKIAVYILWWILAANVSVVHAQHGNKNTEADINKTDHKNRKQGIWYIRKEAMRGEPVSISFGNYVDNKKEGLWYMLDENKNIESIEQYKNDVLDGTSQYFNNGRLVCVGTWRGLNPQNKYDSILVTDPVTLEDTIVVVLAEQGTLKHGIWRFYDEKTGQLSREEEYQVGRIIYRKNFKVHTVTDSLYIEQVKKNQAINKKDTYKPPPGKGKKL